MQPTPSDAIKHCAENWAISDPLRQVVLAWFEQLEQANTQLAKLLIDRADEPLSAIWRALFASDFLRNSVLGQPEYALQLLQADLDLPPPGGAELAACAQAMEPSAALRELRQQAMLRIAWRDMTARANLQSTLVELSDLADLTLSCALRIAREEISARFGQIKTDQGEPIVLYAICMGKLGGRELNFSSDIDIIFVFSADGQSDGARSLSAPEYTIRMARRVIALLDEKTAYGRVFRVDTRLRPFGESGPLVVSLASMELYLQAHGRDWERYAFVKARFINADTCDEREMADEVAEFREQVLRPFVYRGYLDYGVLDSLREMQQMIASEVRRKEMLDHIKLGPGGIREIEFIVQSWQLIRGGQQTSLQTSSLRKALDAIVDASLIGSNAAKKLYKAYEFLRVAENRLQELSDKQTHELPNDVELRERYLLAMDFPSWEAFIAQSQVHRKFVSDAFAQLAFGMRGDSQPKNTDAQTQWMDESEASVLAQIEALSITNADTVAEVFLAFRKRASSARFDAIASERLRIFLNAVFARLVYRENTHIVLERVLRVAESVLRRSAYLSLLNEQEAALERLINVCELSDYLCRQVCEHPMLLDELLDARAFAEPLSALEMAKTLGSQLAHATDEIESRMQLLAKFQRAMKFRIALADFSGLLPIMRVSDHLTQLAQIVLRETLQIAWDELSERYGMPAGCDEEHKRFAIVGYGKLGGLEMGYSSDLDIVFLHALGDGQTSGSRSIENAVFLLRLASKVVHLLNVQTGAGQLYEVDTRLRPSGRSGLLVSSLEGFERYQQEDAWTWEHQALLRARAVAGDAQVCESFEKLRQRILTKSIRLETLREDVTNMRARMRKELSRATAGEFDIKQDVGGVADLEFLVQYLVLRNAGEHPALLEFSDNIRQLDSLRDAGLLTKENVLALQDAYRAFRQRLHYLSLNSLARCVEQAEFADERALVVSSWRDNLADI